MPYITASIITQLLQMDIIPYFKELKESGATGRQKINKINKQDINYVLEECFKPGIISASYVGQDVEIDGLNKIIGISDVAYNRDVIVNDKRV